MKRALLSIFLSATVLFSFGQSSQTLHDFSAETITGGTLDFSTFAGKKLLVVNTATYCVLTPQYDELQELYETYGGNDFEIVGFPANDFFDQEPHGDSVINDFCNNLGITFQMMSKVAVTGTDIAPIYQWLTQESQNGVADAPVAFNFQKFMIDENGQWVGMVGSFTSPLDDEIIEWIESEPTAIDNQTIDNQWRVFPNPVESHLTIKGNNLTEDATIQILDLSGKVVIETIIGTFSSQQTVSISTADIANGIYMLKISNGTATMTQRLVVQK